IARSCSARRCAVDLGRPERRLSSTSDRTGSCWSNESMIAAILPTRLRPPSAQSSLRSGACPPAGSKVRVRTFVSILSPPGVGARAYHGGERGSVTIRTAFPDPASRSSVRAGLQRGEEPLHARSELHHLDVVAQLGGQVEVAEAHRALGGTVLCPVAAVCVQQA